MEKLKTLKDISIFQCETEEYSDWNEVNEEWYNDTNEDKRQIVFEKDELTKEAIKWIKEFKKYDKKNEVEVPDNLIGFYHISKWNRDDGNFVSFEEAINVLRHVYNITDNDLK